MRTNSARGFALALVASMFWAGTAPGIKYLLEAGLPRLTIALWRDVFVAAAILGVLLIVKRDLLKTDRRTLAGLVPAGAITVGLYHLLWVFSVALNGAALAVVLIYLYPAFTTLGARLIFGEPITGVQVIALIMAFCGCALAVRAYDPAVWQVSWLGIAIGLASAVVQATYTLYNQHTNKRMNSWATLGYLMLFGALALLVVTLIAAPSDIAGVPDATAWLWLLLLAIGPTLGGYGLFNMSLRYIPGKVAGLITIMEVPFTAAIAYFAFGESLAPPQLLGVVVLVAATALPNVVAWRAETALRKDMA